LNRSAWGLKIAGIFYIRLVLDACSLVLGAWRSGPGPLVLEACRLQLVACSLEVGTKLSPLRGKASIESRYCLRNSL